MVPMLSSHDAAEIARRHGLSLQDAAGLQSLADNRADAERLAASFATTDPADDTAARDFTRALFDTKD